MTTTDELTSSEALDAMIEFLSAYWERGKSEEIAMLLGSLARQHDGKPADAAMWQDWIAAVEKVVARRS